VGIMVGEVAVAAFGGGYVPLGLASFVAVVIARAPGGARIVIAQAAVSAILVLTTADDDFGVGRLADAAIGAAVAPLQPGALLA
jgi:uncharacterized membrane protein YgaE (UPF0421/DUF939 family)